MNNELIEMYDQKVSELIETIKKEMSGHKLTIEPDSDLLCQEEDCSFSILISLQIQQYQTDDGTVTPLPAEVTFDYRAEHDEWVMLVGQDGDEDLAVTRAGLFEVLFYYCSQAALTQQQDDTHGFKNFHKNLCERFGYGHDEIDWRRDQVSLIEHIAALTQQQELKSAIEDFLIYGTGIMLGGKRIDPADVYLYPENQQQEAEAVDARIQRAERNRGELIKELESLATENARLRSSRFVRFNNDECWIYQGDGSDHLESLVCPVVISAPDLMRILAGSPSPTSQQQEAEPVRLTGKAHECDRCTGAGMIQSGFPGALDEFSFCPECNGGSYIYPPKPAAQPQVPEGFRSVDIVNAGFEGCINLFWKDYPLALVPKEIAREIKTALSAAKEEGKNV